MTFTLRSLELLRRTWACPVAVAVLYASCSPFTSRQELHQLRDDISGDEGCSRCYNRKKRTCRDISVLNICLKQVTVNATPYSFVSLSHTRPLVHTTCTVSSVGVIRLKGCVSIQDYTCMPVHKKPDQALFNAISN
jgi:hypothetical protein